MKKLILIVAILFLSVPVSLFPGDTLRVMFYNTENLFDCKHDSLKNDKDFLPDGLYRWDYFRYKKKLTNIAKTITAVGEWQVPALVGLCEVENDSVIYDLTHRSPLKNLSYRYVVTNSPDQRGIDVALLYQRDQFKLLGYKCYSVPLKYPTRDILHVTGQLISTDTLDVLVCHFPSRLGGEKETSRNRIIAASVLRRKADSILACRAKPNILIMGDFNDYPDCESLYKTLEAKSPEDSVSPFVNLMYPLMKDVEHGSHKFQSEWGILDQIIVTRGLFRGGSVFVKNNLAHIFNASFLLEEDKTYGGERPFRTYSGPRYLGGYSDHLPVWVDLIVGK